VIEPIHKAICTRCNGNGYIKVPNKSVEEPGKEVTVQCPMCESRGELILNEKNFIRQFNPSKFN
jgi:DnaJ-class molecular chaperone